MAIKHLTAPLLAGGVLLGYAAWRAQSSRAKRARTGSSSRHASETSDSPLAGDTAVSTDTPPESARERRSAIENVVFDPETLYDSANLQENPASEEAIMQDEAMLQGIFDVPELDPEREIPPARFARDGVPSRSGFFSEPTTLRNEPKPESSPLVDFASRTNDTIEHEEYEQYQAEGAMAPEDIGVRWLARATEALSPYHTAFTRSHALKEDWVEAGLVAQASMRAADGGELEFDLDDLEEILIEEIPESAVPTNRFGSPRR